MLYRQGTTDYLTVVTSQTAVLQTQLEALSLDSLQLRASSAPTASFESFVKSYYDSEYAAHPAGERHVTSRSHTAG